MASKWDILTERRDALLSEAGKLQDELDGMERTPFGSECVCGQHLATEADFARHYDVPDPRYLNLGNCHASLTAA